MTLKNYCFTFNETGLDEFEVAFRFVTYTLNHTHTQRMLVNLTIWKKNTNISTISNHTGWEQLLRLPNQLANKTKKDSLNTINYMGINRHFLPSQCKQRYTLKQKNTIFFRLFYQLYWTWLGPCCSAEQMKSIINF